jgi:hypothetical protein
MHLTAEMDAALARSNFDLAKLVRTSRVDALASNLERYPVDFALQLHALYANDRVTFHLFVRQRLLHRWLRATWGGGKSFDKLYNTTFGKKPSQGHVAELFSSPGLAAGLEPATTCDVHGDEVTVDRVVIESILAVAEVLLAAHAPLFFTSDAALVACTGHGVGVIASHQGSRCLSTASTARVLFGSQLGQEIEDCLKSLFSDDADMLQALSHVELLHTHKVFDYADGDQVMMHPSLPHLVAGDLADPRAAPAPHGDHFTPVDLAGDPVTTEMVPPAASAAAQGGTNDSEDVEMAPPAAPTVPLVAPTDPEDPEDVEMASQPAPTATLDVAARG